MGGCPDSAATVYLLVTTSSHGRWNDNLLFLVQALEPNTKGLLMQWLKLHGCVTYSSSSTFHYAKPQSSTMTTFQSYISLKTQYNTDTWNILKSTFILFVRKCVWVPFKLYMFLPITSTQISSLGCYLVSFLPASVPVSLSDQLHIQLRGSISQNIHLLYISDLCIVCVYLLCIIYSLFSWFVG